MRLLIPGNNRSVEASVCPSFGRAPIFILWDTDNNEVTYIENPGAFSRGGAGIKAAQAVVDVKADAVLSPRMGKNAADVLEAAKIVIYKTTTDNIEENVKLSLDNKLQTLTDIHPGFHNHGTN